MEIEYKTFEVRIFLSCLKLNLIWFNCLILKILLETKILFEGQQYSKLSFVLVNFFHHLFDVLRVLVGLQEIEGEDPEKGEVDCILTRRPAA